jgi:peroxiredoxin
MRPIAPQLALLLTLAALLAACSRPDAPASLGPATPAPGSVIARESRLIDEGGGRPAEGEAAPDFSYTLDDGTTLRLSDLRGTPVILNFWATWCVPCVEEMPELQRALDGAGGRIAVLAVNRNETRDAIARFTGRVNVSFPLITNTAGDISERYGITNLPITYFISSDGTIAVRQLGALTPARLAELTEALQ